MNQRISFTVNMNIFDLPIPILGIHFKDIIKAITDFNASVTYVYTYRYRYISMYIYRSIYRYISEKTEKKV